MQWIKDKATRGYNYITDVRDRFCNRRPSVNRNNAMKTIEVCCCYNEDDDGFFAPPSYIEHTRNNPIESMGRLGFSKRRNKK